MAKSQSTVSNSGSSSSEILELKQQREAILYASLFQVVGRLTEVCLTSGKDTKEAIRIYSELYDELVINWFKAKPVKNEIKNWLDGLLPPYDLYKRPPEAERELP